MEYHYIFSPDLFEPIDQLLFRHQAFDLIGNPDKRYCIPCRTIFPYATAQEMKEFEQHSLEHSVKKEESAGLLSCTGSTKCSKLFQSKEALAEHIHKCHDKSVKGIFNILHTAATFELYPKFKVDNRVNTTSNPMKKTMFKTFIYLIIEGLVHCSTWLKVL